ncbi:MAG: amidohydrolase [Zoogloeaceae bacterium]|jgi:hippurate hydrolase|nr:amidohydrolase [Zoogloeaceae bacterium]
MKLLDLPFLAELAALRRDLHTYPELAFRETRTAEIVARELTRYGLQVRAGLAGTGVVGVLRAGSGARMIGLRADMDALPLTEQNTFAHASRQAGIMHACGHDGHTAMLLGAARHLAAHPDFDGAAAFIFQPAEESEGGANVMIEAGLFREFPVESVYGLHNWPGIPVGEIGILSGPVMASTCRFEIRIQGRGCHAAMPHQGEDTIVAGSHLVGALQTVVARNLHPVHAAVVSVTRFNAGSAWNILPEEAVLCGTVRSFTREVQSQVEAAMQRLCAGVASAFGVEIHIRFEERYPPTVNSPLETECCRRAARRFLGAERVHTDLLPSLAAEDFSYMLEAKPGCYVWLGNGLAAEPGHSGCSLHNPRYDFNDEALAVGITYWTHLVAELLGQK